MNEHYLIILKEHDNPKLWEYPYEFPYHEAQDKFLFAKNILQNIFEKNFRFESGLQIQDASFHARIFIESDFLMRPNEFSQIRFSNFGNMFSFFNEECIKDDIKTAIVKHLCNLEYVYIPEKALQEQYTGSNAGVTGIDTWWIRYFDWV